MLHSFVPTARPAEDDRLLRFGVRSAEAASTARWRIAQRAPAALSGSFERTLEIDIYLFGGSFIGIVHPTDVLCEEVLTIEFVVNKVLLRHRGGRSLPTVVSSLWHTGALVASIHPQT